MCLVNALVARVLMDYRNVFNQFHFTIAKLWSPVLAGARRRHRGGRDWNNQNSGFSLITVNSACGSSGAL